MTRKAKAGFALLGALVCCGAAVYGVTGSQVAAVCTPATWFLYLWANANA